MKAFSVIWAIVKAIVPLLPEIIAIGKNIKNAVK